VLEYQDGTYKLMDNADHVRPFIDLNLLKSNGSVITFDEATSDLVKYDAGLNEIKRLNGRRRIDLGKNLILNYKKNLCF
jgi:hypothetical protein